MFTGKSKWLFCTFILLGIFLLISCGAEPTASPTPTKIEAPTASTTPITVPTATVTNPPTLDPNATPTATPIKSSLGTDGWQVIDIPLVMETPTPIPTPSAGESAYQLRGWDEAAALNLVRMAEEFSFADNIPFPPNDSRYNYLYDQVAVKLAIQEALHRYPQTRYAKQLEWRIALANTIMGQAGLDVDNAETDTWILQELEKGLNAGLYTPDDLNQALNPHGYTASLSEPVPNLMGRNHPGRILRILWLDTPSISWMEKPSTSLYAALGQDKEGHYWLVRIFSTWNFTHDYDEPYEFGDHTGDRIPEIIFSTAYTNGSWCGYSIAIYQWMNGQFADLSRDQFHFSSCEYNSGTWEYGTRDARGAQPIITRKSIREDSGVTRVNSYRWNGEWYELNNIKIEPPTEGVDTEAEWIIYTMGVRDYQSLVKQIPTFLANRQGGSFVNAYFQFQLAFGYALQNKEVQSLRVFQEIARQELKPNIIPQAAKTYLDTYTGNNDIYRACQAALNVMFAASGEHLYGWESTDYSYFRQHWGYDYYFPAWGRGTLCNLRSAFYQLVGNVNHEQFAQAPELLQNSGVLVRSINKIDLNGDGEPEWVLLLDTPWETSRVDIWVLVNGPKKIVAFPVVDWDRRHFDLPSENVKAWEVKTIQSPNGETIAIVALSDYVYFFQINSEKPEFESLIQWTIKDYTIKQTENELVVEIVWKDGHTITTYYWSNEKSQFINDWQQNALVRHEAETTLLINKQPDKTIPMLNSLLSKPDTQIAHLFYLLGLAYEWKGDEANAVRTYWDLWKNFPDTIYARLAQAKLELK